MKVAPQGRRCLGPWVTVEQSASPNVPGTTTGTGGELSLCKVTALLGFPVIVGLQQG